MKVNTPNKLEQFVLAQNDEVLRYAPEEKIGVVVVKNFPALGKLAALRFVQWVQQNPGGVVSLPTGKTPEYFIRYVSFFLETWDEADTQKLLEDYGCDTAIKPDFSSLHFVQIDEFYPIDPAQHNSFYYYVDKYYLKKFGFDRQKAKLINCAEIGLPKGSDIDDVWPNREVDLSLRYRRPVTNLERTQKDTLEAIDQWCCEYDEKIQSLGGLGFFLGGIGPDGHIAFNVRGSDFHSITRLTPINYETQAASATDLGGIEVARKRHAITIGLATITRNPECTAIIIAAGEAKAQVVKDAISREPHIRFPATVLHKLPNARFYITRGAARYLEERQYITFDSVESPSEETIDKIVIDLALKCEKRVLDLTEEDFKSDRFGGGLLGKVQVAVEDIVSQVQRRLLDKLEMGITNRSKTIFLHTAPHHDDIMLGYFPYAVRNIRDSTNKHTFMYLTSGFTAVTNLYALSMVKNLKKFLGDAEFRKLIAGGYINPANINGRNRDVWQYLDGVAGNSAVERAEGEARRLLRNMMEVFEEEDPDNLVHRIDELTNYLSTQYAGKKDMQFIQQLKGMIREWEADCLWGYLGFDSSSVVHLRLGFYKGDIFTEEPTVLRDVVPILRVLRKVNPNIVTVALDPEASGPDTHYKVLQAVAEALRQYEKKSGRSDIEVLGYRNVWYRFHPAEASLYVPVSLNMFALLQSAFLDAFVSQKNASFPSYEYDGPFSGLAQNIQVEQYHMLKRCLGREFFNDHESPLIRGTRGFVFLRRMTLQEFYSHARELRKSTEEEE